LIILFGVLSYVLILVLRVDVLLTFEKLTRRPNIKCNCVCRMHSYGADSYNRGIEMLLSE